MLFADTSALVKLYVAEAGSEQMRAWTDGQSVAVSVLAYAEAHAAFARHRREGRWDDQAHQQLAGQFDAEWSGLVRVPLADATLSTIPALCARHPLRAGDAVQLASALVLSARGLPVTFASADARLLAAARGESLAVRDPCAQVLPAR
ncbi:type II toxin-antitoxin system VapC family toxin [Myxococcota bacterium]|nr:type II toxin-antitoxin system VapC family toxin [Myxococcota bacterium]